MAVATSEITARAHFRSGLLDWFQTIELRDGATMVDTIWAPWDAMAAVFVRVQGIDTLKIACCGPDARFPENPNPIVLEPKTVCGMRFPGGQTTCELKPHYSWLDHIGTSSDGETIQW